MFVRLEYSASRLPVFNNNYLLLPPELLLLGVAERDGLLLRLGLALLLGELLLLGVVARGVVLLVGGIYDLLGVLLLLGVVALGVVLLLGVVARGVLLLVGGVYDLLGVLLLLGVVALGVVLLLGVVALGVIVSLERVVPPVELVPTLPRVPSPLTVPLLPLVLPVGSDTFEGLREGVTTLASPTPPEPTSSVVPPRVVTSVR